MIMKPFLTYIGSKAKFISNIEKYYPPNIHNYFEPFVGGGSILFDLNKKYEMNKNYINDLDPDVINVYRTIKTDHKKLIKYLHKLQMVSSKKDFESLVEVFNKGSTNKVLKAAIYIFINKRSFNGNLKYNQDNIAKPSYVAKKKKLSIFNEENIQDISKLTKKMVIKNDDYISFLEKNRPKKGDFVFLDPPYLTRGATQYYQNIFDLDDYKELKAQCDKLDRNNVNWMVTVNKHPQIQKLFKGYNIHTFKKKYAAFSNGKFDEYEMVITNY